MAANQPDFNRYVDQLGDLLCRFEDWRVVHRIDPTLSLALLSVAAPLAASFEKYLSPNKLTETIEAAKSWLVENSQRFAPLYEAGDDDDADLEDALSDAASDDPPPAATKPPAAKKRRGEDWRRK